jgi:hypothetical protein
VAIATKNQYLIPIKHNLTLLKFILRDIRDFFDGERDDIRMKIEEFRLSDFLSEINNIFSYLAAIKGIDF